MNLYIKSLKNIFNYSGKSKRTEWWLFFLISNIIILVATFICIKYDLYINNQKEHPLSQLLSIYFLLASVSLSVRRLHDINMSGWWAFLFIPLGIPMLIVGLIPSREQKISEEDNKSFSELGVSHTKGIVSKTIIDIDENKYCEQVMPEIEKIENHIAAEKASQPQVKLVEDYKVSEYEEAIYKEVADELSNNMRKEGLWLKAIEKTNGDENKALALYIKYRSTAITEKKLKWDKYKINHDKGRLLTLLKNILKEYGYYQFSKTTVYKKYSDNNIALEVRLDEDRELLCILDVNNHEIDTIKI